MHPLTRTLPSSPYTIPPRTTTGTDLPTLRNKFSEPVINSSTPTGTASPIHSNTTTDRTRLAINPAPTRPRSNWISTAQRSKRTNPPEPLSESFQPLIRMPTRRLPSPCLAAVTCSAWIGTEPCGPSLPLTTKRMRLPTPSKSA